MRFEDLDVWKRATRLAATIHQHFQGSREYSYKDQITRSALSIASNVAEGYERASDKDRIQFLNYAKGSSGELRTQIYVGMEVGLIDKKTGHAWINETRELSKMLYGLMKALGKR
jgi:four helix bundle protein